LQAVKYNLKSKSEIEYGLIAEEVYQVFPELVKLDENGNVSSLHYARLTSILIEAIKELNNKIIKLENL